ncbi:MAG: hypothetical protein EYC70_14465 [Planctomycetota bacterium]|nr:MAG: hypothetical protein EYC70_14465 [Planctomycetota bacterium]
MQFLRPDAILSDAEALYLDHVLLVEGAHIAALVPYAELGRAYPVQRYPGELWTAAPVLAHAHLESHDAPSARWRRERFAEWVGELLAWRAQAGRLSPRESAWRALAELSAAGCGLVLAHVGEPGADGRFGPQRQAAPRFPEVVAFPEIFAPDPAETEDWLARLDRRPPQAGGGYALHAPYSVSESLATGVFARARAWSVLVSIHLGEHAEERQMLQGAGPLSDLFAARGRPGKSGTWRSPVDWLAAVGGLRAPTLAVHGGDLDAAELDRLHRAKVPVAWCPGTHEYFNRPRPAFGGAGLPPPALGCDSRASNAALDPLREVRLARRLLPEFGPQAWWAALTHGGAQALRRRELGVLAAGRQARVLRLPWSGESAPAELCDRLTGDAQLRPLGPVCEPGSNGI